MSSLDSSSSSLLLKLIQQVLDHASFFVFLSFLDVCWFNHLVQFRFSLRTFFTACVPRIRLIFRSGQGFLLTSPLMRALFTFFPGKLPPT